MKALGSKTTAKKVLRRATNLATTKIQQAAKAKVPVDEGDLKKALTKKVYGKNFAFNGIVGADMAAVGEDGKNPANYDHLVEHGHVTPEGKEVPAQPFLRPAWDSSIGEAKATYERELKAGIEREAERLAGKGGK